MQKSRKSAYFPSGLLLLAALLPLQAHAYLDPGTGSFILQMAVAGFLGAMLYIKLAWANIKIFFLRLFSKYEEPESLLDNPEDVLAREAVEEKPKPARQQ